MEKKPKTDLPCPFCNGTGKYDNREDARCRKCRGAGYTGLITGGGTTTRVYCDCQMGKDLERMDKRIADEQAWDIGQQGAADPVTFTDRLKGALSAVRYKPEDEPDE